MSNKRQCRGVGILVGVDIRGGVDRYGLDDRIKVGELNGFGHWTFIQNHNLHKVDRCLRGAVIATRSDVGYILKAEGTLAVYQSVLPARGPVRLISLRDSDNIPLQQVGGPLLWDGTKLCKCRQDDKGYVSMDPEGCDKVHVSTSNIPLQMVYKLRESSFSSIEETTKGERTKLPPKVQVVYVLCTREQRHRGDETFGDNHKSLFMLPIGNLNDVTDE